MRFVQLKQQLMTVWLAEPKLMKIIMGLLGFNVLLLMVMNYVLSPAILTTERELIQLQSEVRSLGTGGSPISSQSLYRSAGEDIEAVKEIIPDREKLSGLLLDLFTLAEKAGFSIDSVSYDPDKLEELNLLSYSLSFTVTGSYRQVKKFIHLLEASPRVVILDSISLVEAKGENRISMRLKMKTYFQQGSA